MEHDGNSIFILTVVSTMAAKQASASFDGDSPGRWPAKRPAEPQADEQPDLEIVRRELCAGVERLIRSSQRLIRWRSMVLWASGLLLALGGLILIDLLLRREEVGLRLLFSTIFWGVAAYTFYKLIGTAWRFSPDKVDVTRWIEKSNPKYEGRLSTAVQLAAMGPADDKFGSRQFRDAALRHWRSCGLTPDWDSYLQTSSLWRSIAIFLTISGLLMAVSLVRPAESMTGIKRLLLPWSAAPWPRDDLLVFHNLPGAVARGSELQLEVVDRKPPLPAEVEVQIREPGSQDQYEVVATQIVADMAVANLPVMERTIEVRAVGGDDDRMDWQLINVVLPPKLEDSQFSVRPPAYSEMKPFELAGPRVQVLTGSQLAFRGKLSEPVQAMALKLVNPPLAEQDQRLNRNRPQLELQLMQDGQSFVIFDARSRSDLPGNQSAGDGWWEVTETISWHLLIKTEAGLEVSLPEVWTVEVTPDRPPVVVMQDPPLNELTSDANLPVLALAQDDLGLRGIRLRAELSGLAEESSVAAGDGQVDAEAQTLENQDKASVDNSNLSSAERNVVERWLWQDEQDSDASPQTRRRSVQYDWRVADDLAMSSGQRLTVWVEAIDSLGQVGTSQKQDYTIRSPREILESVRSQEQQIVERMRDLVNAQRRNMQLATRIEGILSESEEVDQGSLEGLSSVTQIQDSVRKRLAEGSNSLIAQLQVIRELLMQNQMDESDAAQQLDQLASQLEALHEDVLADALRQATQAQQQAAVDFQSESAALQPDSMAAIQQSTLLQKRAVQEMQSILDGLMQNEALQQLRAELLRVLENQREIQTQTEELGLERLAGADSDQIDSRSRRLNAEQQSLARQLEDLVFRMQRSIAGNDLEPERAETISRATDRLQQDQAGSTMRESAEQISNAKVMQAVQSQKRAIASLETAVSILGGDSSLDRNGVTRSEQLKQASERIAELAELQSSVAGEMSAADSEAAREELAARQDELASATQAVKQQLDALGDQAGSRALQAALEAQAQAESALEQSENQRAAESAKRAAEELERAADSATDRSQRLDEQDRQDRKFELLESLQVLVEEQQQIKTQLRQAGSEVAGTSPSDSDPELEPTSARLSAIADRQRDAEQSLAAVRQSAGGMQADQAQAGSNPSDEPQAASFQVFRWTLEQASLDMTRAAAAAERMRVDPEAIDAAGAALAKLQMALEAIEVEPAQTAPETNQQSDSQPEEQGEGEQSGNLIPPLATLKLLRSLQANVNERTKNLDEAELARPLRNQLLSELSRQQQEIGKQLETWVQRMAASRATRGK